MLEALPKQVRHLDKEGSAVAAEAWLKRTGKGVKPVAIEIVVVTYIESGAGIRCIAEQELSLNVCSYRIKIDAATRKQEAAELISSVQGNDVFIKGDHASVVTR